MTTYPAGSWHDPDIIAEELGKIFGLPDLKASMITASGVNYEGTYPGGGLLRVELLKSVSTTQVNEMMQKARGSNIKRYTLDPANVTEIRSEDGATVLGYQYDGPAL